MRTTETWHTWSASNRLPCVLAAVLLGVTLAAVPVRAHHSFAAEFDVNKPVTLVGAVTKIEWSNPHAFFYLDVKDETGKMTNWAVELGSPNALFRSGWKRDSLKIGDQLTMDGYLAKDGSSLANARMVQLADGRKVFAGSSGDGGPTK